MSLNRKIRVLHMGIDDRRGGIETFLVELARNIDWNSFQFDFFCYGNNPAYAEELKSYGARLISLPNRRNFVAYRNAIRTSLDDGYDILHLHKNSPADFLPLLWSGKTKVVAHSHNGEHSSGLIDKTVNSIGRSLILSSHVPSRRENGCLAMTILLCSQTVSTLRITSIAKHLA